MSICSRTFTVCINGTRGCPVLPLQFREVTYKDRPFKKALRGLHVRSDTLCKKQSTRKLRGVWGSE